MHALASVCLFANRASIYNSCNNEEDCCFSFLSRKQKLKLQFAGVYASLHTHDRQFAFYQHFAN